MRSILLFFALVIAVFASEVGKFSLVKGEVSVLRDGQTLNANSGDLVYNKDIITTKKASKTQIRFKDGTIVTLGKDTSLNIKDYIFNKEQSVVDMGVDDGSFKVITGEIGKVARNNFKFKANSATIGIRGTIFAGEVGVKHNMIACVQGSIVVSAGEQMKQVSAGKMVEVVNDKLGDIKPIDTKNIETISSIDSNKVNDDIAVTENKDNSNKKLDVNSNIVANVATPSVVSQNSSDAVKTPKVTNNEKDIGNLVSQDVSVNIPSVDIPLVPENKPIIPEFKPNPPVIDQVLNDRKNSVFYYSGKYTLDSNHGKQYDYNAKAKVDYGKSGSYIVIKQKVDNSVQDRFDFGPHDAKDRGYYIRFENFKGDEMKLMNSQGKSDGPLDRLKFESHQVTLSNGLKYKQEMEGSSATKNDFDSY